MSFSAKGLKEAQNFVYENLVIRTYKNFQVESLIRFLAGLNSNYF